MPHLLVNQKKNQYVFVAASSMPWELEVNLLDITGVLFHSLEIFVFHARVTKHHLLALYWDFRMKSGGNWELGLSVGSEA